MQTTTHRAGGPTVILAVEDEDLLRMMTVSILEDMGHHVISAASAEEALAVVRSEPGIDLLFTDIRMPGIDGFQLAERVCALRPTIKVIYATGYATGYAEVESRPSANAQGPLLRKPYAPETLADEIVKLLADRDRSEL